MKEYYDEADDPNDIGLMLEFFYTQTYETEQTPDHKPVPVVHVSLYALGDKYGIPTLCNYSADCFRKSIRQSTSTAQLIPCIPLVYRSTPGRNRTLRDLIVSELICRSADVATDIGMSDSMMRFVHSIEQFREDLVLGLLQSQVLARDERANRAFLGQHTNEA
ncbi:MAG: hypothetical protein Q9225_006620 [Loekoesia sp. 1 TL-2023]